MPATAVSKWAHYGVAKPRNITDIAVVCAF